ncbi:MAG: hypothetical protein ACREQ3_07940 [Candidatus Binatia bacterium]
MSDKSRILSSVHDSQAMHSQPLRSVRFPTDRSLGILWVREYSTEHYTFWESYGDARGTIIVPESKELRLNVSPQASTDLSPLAALHAEDLQYLQLSGTRIINAGLGYLRTLTGLRVLWLYDTRISDAGLVHLQGLTGLRVLNLRSTLVSPGGVDALQAALPQCEIRRMWK